MPEKTESTSKYWLRRTEKIPPGISNSKPKRRCDECHGALPKRQGFPVNRGRRIVCGGCMRLPKYARA